MKVVKQSTWVLVLFAIVGSSAFAGSIEEKFEERYAAWRAWIATNKFRSTFTACKEYQDIVALGVPALPLMIKKMENRFDDFHLGAAVCVVSKRDFDVEEWPKGCLGDSIAASKMYIDWWRVGRFQTGARFKALYAR